MKYSDFLESKKPNVEACGIEPGPINPILFDWQSDIVKWALRRGRAALFEDCGLGKTFQQVEWARQIRHMDEIGEGRVLILAPLSVAQQTIEEAKKLGVEVVYKAEPDDSAGIWITNYQRLHKFVSVEFIGIVLDESSILKSLDGKTRTLLLKQFTNIPYRLCCTATPAPNDLAELANHAEFLGAMPRIEMLATYFVHDSERSGSDGWRLKGHAQEDFWRWVAQWAVYIRRPSDLGFPDGPFQLPPLNIIEHAVDSNFIPDGKLFPDITKGITGRIEARKHTTSMRTQRAAEVIKETWKRKVISKHTTNGIEIRKSQMPESGNKPIGTNESLTCGSITSEINSKCLNSNERSESKIPKRQKHAGKPITKSIASGTSEIQNNGAQPIPQESEIKTFVETTESQSRNTILFGRDNQDAALSVEQKETPILDHSLLTTAIQPESSEVCSVAHAISASVNSKTIRTDFEPPPNTSKEQWVVWCGLNKEQNDLARLLGEDCVSIQGSTPDEDRVTLEKKWRDGKTAVLLVKPGQFGFGMNWQNCHNVMFLGLDDSFEKWYQSVRRCWRFGQEKPVSAFVISSDAESQVVANVRRKEQQAEQLAQGIIDAMKDAQIESVLGKISKKEIYKMHTETGDGWEMKLGDCVERVKEIETASVGMSVFSPPFAHLYTYSASDRDMGNSKDYDQFFKHFGFLIPELLRVTAPGRRCCVHVQQLTTTKTAHGVIGWRDFRADVVRNFVELGWVYDGEVVIDKDPQAQAIRTKAKALMFVQKNKDSAWSRPAMADYILLFRAPGENAEPIKTDVSNEEWIQFARPIWYGIDESDTLNYRVARENADERHICPLQLGTIERCVRLWSNRGDLVLDPFSGIGSTGVVALQHGRRFVGIELKESYFNQAVKNLKAAVKQESLFAA